MVGVGEPGPGAANCAGIGIGRHAEGFVPAEADLREHDLDGLGRGILQEDRQRRGPGRHGGARPAPVVDLAGGVAGEASEDGLTDVSAGQQGGEFGA